MKKIGITIAIFYITMLCHAQHEHGINDSVNTKEMNDTMQMKNFMMNMYNMHMHHENQMPGMNHSFSLSLPMNRNGSGTSWSFDYNSMYMIMVHTKKGMWMFHGTIFIRYNTQQFTHKTSRS